MTFLYIFLSGVKYRTKFFLRLFVIFVVFIAFFSLFGKIGSNVAFANFSDEEISEDISIHLYSHEYLMDTSRQTLERSLILKKSLQYMYLKNKKSEGLYPDLYLLEKENKDFIFNALEKSRSTDFSRPAQYMAKLRDLETFANRDIVAELDTIGEDYKKREDYINEYIALGDILEKTSSDDAVYFESFFKSVKAEVSDLQNQKKTLLKEYEVLVKNKNIQEVEKIKKEVIEVSKKLAPKELQVITYGVFAKKVPEVSKNLEKRLNAVKENKDALIKNVKIKLESGKYINIIEK